MMDIATLEREALNLDVKSRGRLASILLRSLDEEDDDSLSSCDIDGRSAGELDRRDNEMDDDPSMAVPYEEAMSRLRALFG